MKREFFSVLGFLFVISSTIVADLGEKNGLNWFFCFLVIFVVGGLLMFLGRGKAKPKENK